MHLDVQELKNFYYRSALGRSAQKEISKQVLKMWPVQSGYKMMGYGFANFFYEMVADTKPLYVFPV